MNNQNTHAITPFLNVNNCKKAIEFYSSAWGGIALEEHKREDEKMMVKISIGGTEFWVGDEEPEYGNVSPNASFNSSVRFILETKNADDFFTKAIDLGATEICPMTTEDTWRIGKLKDPFGHVWEIGYLL